MGGGENRVLKNKTKSLCWVWNALLDDLYFDIDVLIGKLLSFPFERGLPETCPCFLFQKEDIAHLASLPWLLLTRQYFPSSPLCPKAKAAVLVEAAALPVEGSSARPRQAPGYSNCPKRNCRPGGTSGPCIPCSRLKSSTVECKYGHLGL